MRSFPLAVGLLIAAMAAVQVITALQESQTYDEAVHLTAGYSYLKTGDYRLNVEHPPLGKMLSALPLLLLRPRLPLEEASWEDRDEYLFADSFVYHNRYAADTILFLGRSMNILLTALFALGFAVWTRREFGPGVALLALFLFVLDPNLVAHGRYVTTDLIAACFFFFTSVMWVRFLERRRRPALIIAGVVFGLALISKYSMLVLAPLLVVLYMLKWWQGGQGLSMLHLLRSFAVVTLIAWLVVLIAYAPEIDSLQVVYRARRALDPDTDYGPLPRSLEDVADDTPVGRWFCAVGHALQLPAHPWLVGLYSVAWHNQGGHDSYLLGHYSRKGFRSYFPVVFAVKTPTAGLLLLAAAIPLAIVALLRGRLRGLPFRWIALVVPAAVYFALAMSSGIDIGVRHLLPFYPPLFILIAGVILKRAPRRLTVALLSVAIPLQVYEFTRIYPYYLSFFNTVCGGPERGHRYLLDSNIDWGQDAKRLAAWFTRRDIHLVRGLFFGRVPLPYYGLFDDSIPANAQELADLDCFVFASITPLYGMYTGRDSFTWLRARTPIARIGYSIYVYDLRKKR